MMVGLTRKGAANATVEARELNGLPALITREGGVITSAVLLEVADGRIHNLYIVRNPDKLAGLGN
jgi:RNA polymerase sigma-70 factor (ECF subfamily)